ncbi:hypothetical protein [uncultured Sphingomonas sp.]|uniref:hypothetical protein n=1 Tax=uncultured Sphingomonas sp. TaxID=158754 RepID=UPI002611AFB0|nr:hypothetical protein [uncultured Sphingomonas sp.]
MIVKPYSRWSAETETAFLLALRLTGNVRKAAAEIGRDPGSAYKRRQRDPDFAARWAEAVAAQQRAFLAAQAARLDGDGGAAEDRLFDGRERGGWDANARARFLRALARTGCVIEACAVAGVSKRAAYALRQRSPRFAAAWKRALEAEPPRSIEAAAYERAVEGWLEPVFFQGEVVGHRRRYSDSALRLLLAKAGKEAAKEAAGPDKGYASAEETNRVLLARLDAIARRRQREAIAFADRMVAEGKAP